MKINKSGAKFSSIVGIGEKIKKIEKEIGVKYLPLNRGINDVVNIDLSKIIKEIDFNSKEIQQYPPNSGVLSLRNNGDNPIGIFAIINKSEDFLFQNKIGAVGLDKFVYNNKNNWSSYSRICVSVQHEIFIEYFSKII